MTRIVLYGDVDMRPFAYGLLKVISAMGTTLFLTSNRLFLGASEDDEDRFFLGDANILVGSSVEELFTDASWDRQDYDYVVYDCQRVIPPNADYIVHIVTGNQRRNDFQNDMMSLIDTAKKFRVAYCSNSIRSPYITKEVPRCVPAGSNAVDVQWVEDNRMYGAVTDPKFKKLLAFILSVIFEDTVAHYEQKLSRGWNN